MRIATLSVSGLVLAAALISSTPMRLSSFDPQVNELLARMTLDEKIGQMTQADKEYVKDQTDVETLFLGSILNGGNSDPDDGNSLEAWTNMVDNFQKHALKTRLRIPLLYGVDSVHGHSNVLGAVILPHNIGLGCTRNAALLNRIMQVTAEETRATGINWAFAPCVTVPQDPRWGRTYEGYSEDPGIVRDLAGPAVLGLQSDSLTNPLGVLACAKHYVGDGGTAFGSSRNGKGLDQGDTRVDEATLRSIHLQGYYSAVRAGVGSIMPSYSSWNGVKMSGNKYLLTDVLKGELGFEGFLISDYNAIDQIKPNDYKASIAISINAGMDMGMIPGRYKEFIRDLKALVGEGRVPMSRIDDAVRRILRVKFAMGLMDAKRSVLADRSLHKNFGSPEHRAVAREAVRESLVVLKNDNHTLPIAKTARRIHLAGKTADDIGNQCGGWTIFWQGKSGPVSTGGTTILAAIRNSVSKNTQVTFSLDGSGAAGADIAVVVIGEKPYAEGMGDRLDLSLAPEDAAVVRNSKSAGVPVAVVVVSGRPLVLGDVMDQAGAVVAAWLPGTEGQGVADVLLGDYKPSGKLSFSWPRVMGKALFPVGYGQTWDR
jgi:beta-glucosidase